MGLRRVAQGKQHTVTLGRGEPAPCVGLSSVTAVPQIQSTCGQLGAGPRVSFHTVSSWCLLPQGLRFGGCGGRPLP